MHKILVCGGREFNRGDVVYNTMEHYARHYGENMVLIVGGARGADRLAQQWAEEREIVHIVCPAPWKTQGRMAGFARNLYMLDTWSPELLVAFPGGNGTAHMCRIAEAAGVPVHHISG